MPLLLPELLCPAGDEAALRAAVDSGANAVYLGYRVFGARASAVNFDAEALEAAVRYAMLTGMGRGACARARSSWRASARRATCMLGFAFASGRRRREAMPPAGISGPE